MNTGVYSQLLCVVSQGDMPVSITWSLKGQKLNSGPDITTTMLGQRTSMLTIASVSYLHIGEYTCRATNPAGSVTHSAELKVNGKFASVTFNKALEISSAQMKSKQNFLCFRTTTNHPVHIWEAGNRFRRLCPVDLRCLKG